MKSLSELSVIFVVILAFTAVTSVRSEYTWNGSEWVWSESSDTKVRPSFYSFFKEFSFHKIPEMKVEGDSF